MGMARPAGSRAELMSRVQAAVQGTASTLVPTQDGFVVHTSSPFRDREMIAGVTHHVRLDERTRTLTITDEIRGRDAEGGRSAQRGRYSHRSFEMTFGRRKDGTFGKIDEQRFRTDDARRLVVDAATALGWTLRRSGAEKAGLVAALIGAGVAGLVLIAVVIVLAAVLLL
ncbi:MULTISPECIES: hypothetical protein [Actinomadura]|uniref:hypothetical protein n=1 Tax=Actinomadura TaxID=1988 RepID=UPI0003F85337|nr:hypothetical protein [Actinomadura madurae]SPT57220.1 Uncharacterised protein [Actinomadura madurae]